MNQFTTAPFNELEVQKSGSNCQSKQKTFDQLCDSYNNLAAFDWELKDVKNLKHSPERELTPLVYWFWINS